MLTEWAENQVKVLDFQGKLRIQQKLIEDKETHFKNVFMPQFEKESKEAKETDLETKKETETSTASTPAAPAKEEAPASASAKSIMIEFVIFW